MMKGLRGFYDLMRGDERAVLEMLPEVMGNVAAEDRLRCGELYELLAGSTILGPDDPPAWTMALFRRAEREAGVSAELLAATSWCFTRFRPEAPGGLLALPEMWRGGRPVHATVEELERWDAAAAERLRFGVLEAARRLAGFRADLPTGVVGALVEYSSYAAPEDRYESPREAAYAIAHTTALYLARRTRGGRLEAGLKAMLADPAPEDAPDA